MKLEQSFCQLAFEAGFHVRTNKILITEPMPFINEELEILQPNAEVQVANSTEEEVLLKIAPDVDVIMVVYAKITSKLIESAKRLKGIVRYGIGIDNIDVGAASKRKIPIANVPDYAIETVADHAMALALALARRILEADRAMRSRNWGVWSSPSVSYRGVDLSGKIISGQEMKTCVGQVLNRIGRPLTSP